MSRESNILFFDVFEGLSAPKDVSMLFEDVIVDRVVASNAKAILKIYIRSHHIINSKKIKTMEYQLHKQLFPSLSVTLFERYDLSAQYTPKKLMEIYKKSLLDEVKERSVLEYNILKHGKIEYFDNTFCFDVEDNFLYKSVCQDFANNITQIFKNRFNYDIQVKFKFYKPKKSKNEYIKPNCVSIEDMQFDANVNDLNSKSSTCVDDVESEGSTQVEQPVRPKQTANNNVKTHQPSYLRNTKDPDIFYGRGFDGESMFIKDIQDEIGEVIVRGKILNTDTFDIRNNKTIVMFSITDFTDSIGCKVFIKTDEVPILLKNIKKVII